MNSPTTPHYSSARSFGLASCSVCGLLNRLAPSQALMDPAVMGQCFCHRCGTKLEARKPNSLSRSWAYLLAAVIAYIPANLYPALQSRTVAGDESDTILQGVVLLWQGGSWPLALLVFFASVVVPLLKLIAMTVLLLSVHTRSAWRLHERAQLYRLVEFVGRWSMLDIFVVAILVGLVHLRSLATMEAGPGALAFGAVVVLTMLAAQSFDPRLLWDAAGRNGRD
jgi:paraquat-inducible protein A